ncbi:MAG: hypothetical protein ACP5NS_04080 [Candidatus Pacearchaeota archaeon]
MHKKDHSSSSAPKQSKETLEDQTLHSLIELQKVHVNLAEKFDKLTQQIQNLLGLFELAARNFAKQPHMQATERDKEFLEKIDKLLDQNKVLAKGLTLMEDKMRERLYGPGARPQFRGPPQQFQPSQQIDEL